VEQAAIGTAGCSEGTSLWHWEAGPGPHRALHGRQGPMVRLRHRYSRRRRRRTDVHGRSFNAPGDHCFKGDDHRGHMHAHRGNRDLLSSDL